MNKLGVVLGVAAIATITGCRDPNYDGKNGDESVNEVKTIASAPDQTASAGVSTATVGGGAAAGSYGVASAGTYGGAGQAIQVSDVPVTAGGVKPVGAGKSVCAGKSCAAGKASAGVCTCAPGTKHTAPCTCGGVDCKCIVETKAIGGAGAAALAAGGAATTVYIVQKGDTLSKISKKYNIKLDAIRAANPSVKNDMIRLGQKIQLPGQIEVGAQTVPAGAVAKAAPKVYQPYAGATKEYVVKSGDTLGAIAYGNGINVRQLKELNGLKSDFLKINQKLLIPANGKAAAAKTTVIKVPASVVKAVSEKPVAAKAVTVKVAPVATATADGAATAVVTIEEPNAEAAAPVEAATVVTVEEPKVETTAASSASTTTYVVQEGDDITGVSMVFGVPASQIMELNNLAAGEQLKPGQIIKLPAENVQ